MKKILFIMVTSIWAMTHNALTTKCSISNDSIGRLVYNCEGNNLLDFPSNIPNNTLVLLLRRTMKSPTVPPFHSKGLGMLQVLDLSWNSINYLSSDTFKHMTSLLSLDIRGNNVFSSIPEGFFSYLVSLNILQIDGNVLSFENSFRFIKETRDLKSLNSFVFNNGDLKLGVQIASQYVNLTSLAITKCSFNDLTLNQVLNDLKSLTQLKSITLFQCFFNTARIDSTESFKWMSNVRNMNLACNDLNLFDVIKYIGSQSSLAQLDTLVIDHNSLFDPQDIYRTYAVGFKIFCNQSFSSSLRRLSIQKTKAPFFDTVIVTCLPNLRSISIGYNVFAELLHKGNFVPAGFAAFLAVLEFSASLFYLKASAIQTIGPSSVCLADDISFDEYFIDEKQFHDQKPLCKWEQSDDYFQKPSCLRAVQLDFCANGMKNIAIASSIDIWPKNSIELLNFSYSVVSNKGSIADGVNLNGLDRLRILHMRHMNVIFFHKVTFNQAENMQDIDLSDNNLEQMTAEQLSDMFTKPLYIRKLNLSSCNIVALNSDFLSQFPRLIYLDLSYNKLRHLSLNLSWLTSFEYLTIDLSFNQISIVHNSFIESVQLVNQFRNVTLKMNDNQFRCDCDNIAFLRWFLNTNNNIENKDNIFCNYHGLDTEISNSLNVDNLEFQCTQYMRILYLSVSIVFGITTVGIVSGIMLFKYRWHIRWYWYQAKRRIQGNRGQVNLQFPNDYKFLCYVNYLGVTCEWVMQNIVTPIENLNNGDVFLFERNAVAGIYVLDAIMDGINSSRKLLYVIGNEQNVGEHQWFFFSLQLAAIERLKDIIVISIDVAALQNLQQRIPVLRPSRTNSITHVQYETNDVFWPEISQQLNSNCI